MAPHSEPGTHPFDADHDGWSKVHRLGVDPDDLIDTGGTICKAAALLKEKGARSVRAVCTHPILSNKAFENIESSVMEEVVVSDTIPLKHPFSKIRVLTVSDLFAKAIRKIHDHESISSLFIRL